jgi:hypothetical protein
MSSVAGWREEQSDNVLEFGMCKILISLLVGLLSIADVQAMSEPQGFYYKTGGDDTDQWYQVLTTEGGQYAITDV